VRGRLGAVIAGPALTEETQLFVVGVVLAAQLTKARGEFEVALAVEFKEFTARDTLQDQRVLVEAFGDASYVEVRERTDRVQTESLTGRRDVLSTEYRERKRTPKRLGRARLEHESAPRAHLGAEESVGDAERGLVTREFHDRGANVFHHRGLATEEPTRSSNGQYEQTEAHRLGEGAQDAQRGEERQVITQRRAVGRLFAQGLDPYREEALH